MMPLSIQAADESTIFGSAVHPILEAKCVGCHGEKKQKGKLRLDSFEAVAKGGSSGEKSIVPTKSAESELYKRLILPEDDDDHMPPEGKKQLSKEEMEIIKWWIDSDGTAGKKLVVSEAPEGIQAQLKKLAEANPNGPKKVEKKADGPVVPKPTAEQEKAIAKLQEDLGIVVLPIAQDNPGLSFTAVNVVDKFGDAELAKFDPIAANLLDVNIARTKVTDAGLATLGKMTNLTRLRAEKTGITDGGMDHLKGLANLRYLNLYGTKVTDAGLMKLAELKNLRRVYAWQTGVTKEGAAKLHAKLPEVLINLGWDNEVGAKPKIVRAPAPKDAPAEEKKDDSAFGGLIQPILAGKCAGCHGAEKQKGKLAVHTFEALMKGGKDGKTVVAGKSAESTIFKRISLPADDDDHMPPKDKDQLSKKDIALLKWWIDSGADGKLALKDAKVPAEILTLK